MKTKEITENIIEADKEFYAFLERQKQAEAIARNMLERAEIRRKEYERTHSAK